MNPTLTEILQALFSAHQQIDQLRVRVQELEEQNKKLDEGWANNHERAMGLAFEVDRLRTAGEAKV